MNEILNKRLITWVGLAGSLIVSVSTLASNGKYPIKNFSPSEYRAGIQNIDFSQNRGMDIFVANNLGILSYNGTDWETHAANTGKKQRSLAFDEESNRLYVGSQGEFGFFENNWDYTSLFESIPEGKRDFDEVWDVFIYDRKVYFCTFQRIYVFDGNSVFTIENEGGFNKSFLAGKMIFTQSPSGELLEIDGQKLISFKHRNQFNENIVGIIPKDNGYILFYNSGNIQFAYGDSTTEIFINLAESIQGKYVNHVMKLSDSRYVISTQTSGLYLYNEQTDIIENISTHNGLLSNACLRAFQDYDGNLWVGMQNGIAVVDVNSPLRLINQDINLQGSGYEAFDSEDGSYFTTSNGIYFLGNNTDKSTFLEGTEGPSYGLQRINRKIYAGHHTGLFLLERNNAKRIAFTDGLWQIKQLQSNPNYVIGGTYSGLHLFKIADDGLLDDVGKIDGFNESSRFFEEDRNGRIWVGQYYKGLYRVSLDSSYREAEVKNISESNKFPIKKYIVLNKIDNELYISSSQGIYRLDQGSDEILEEKIFSSSIGKEWVYVLMQDKLQNVHIFSENHVGFFKQMSPNNYVYNPSSLFQLRQLFNNDLLNVSKNIDNGVYFNANSGFIHYNPNVEKRYNLDKRPLVSGIYSVIEDSILYSRLPFQGMRKLLEPIRTHTGVRILQFSVEFFKYTDVENQSFRYYLKGFDDDYGDWTNSRFKEYTNLKEGSYEFTVQTLNSLGEIVTSQPYRVVILPPFYRSLIAKIVYVILIMIGLYQLYRFQRLYYKGKQLKLEQSKRIELAQKQEELQELKEEQINSELQHVNNLLAASTMNLVIKNEFMEKIKDEIKRITGESEAPQEALEGIIKEIDTTLKVQEDWRQFEYHFDKVHGDFLSRLTNEFHDLTPGEQKLCAFLRLKMNTKEIANLMGISIRGIEVARYRLRKKLGLGKSHNLSKFILEY